MSDIAVLLFNDNGMMVMIFLKSYFLEIQTDMCVC